MTYLFIKTIGQALLFAGLLGCVIVIAMTVFYKALYGDGYDTAKKTRKEGLCLFLPPTIIGLLITLFTL